MPLLVYFIYLQYAVYRQIEPIYNVMLIFHQNSQINYSGNNLMNAIAITVKHHR
ncbi:hypothetical protein [Nostoc sp.]|uniref:hypothetical protein n=1 Tax=Nostoc sp. TaxID=1180 RepID=UPI002FFC8ACF